MVRRIIFRLRKSNRGVAMIEFAIVLPLLVVLVMGIVEFGWILNGYITITGAAREGARAAIVDEDYEDAVDEHLKSLPSLTLKSPPSIRGGESAGDALTVILNGELPLLIGFFDFLGKDGFFEYKTEVTMRREYAEQ